MCYCVLMCLVRVSVFVCVVVCFREVNSDITPIYILMLTIFLVCRSLVKSLVL